MASIREEERRVSASREHIKNILPCAAGNGCPAHGPKDSGQKVPSDCVQALSAAKLCQDGTTARISKAACGCKSRAGGRCRSSASAERPSSIVSALAWSNGMGHLPDRKPAAGRPCPPRLLFCHIRAPKTCEALHSWRIRCSISPKEPCRDRRVRNMLATLASIRRQRGDLRIEADHHGRGIHRGNTESASSPELPSGALRIAVPRRARASPRLPQGEFARGRGRHEPGRAGLPEPGSLPPLPRLGDTDAL